MQRQGDEIVFYARISGSSPENLSVIVYYMFEQDIGTEDDPAPPQSVRMTYNESTGYWSASIEKKYDASTLHYYLKVRDSGTGDELRTEDSTYSYTTPLDFKYPWCIAGAIVAFAAFEIVMHYGRIRERFPGEKEEKEDDEGSEEL